jgi:hypothetical protein
VTGETSFRLPRDLDTAVRGRRTLRVHLGPDAKAGLALLRQAIESLEN